MSIRDRRTPAQERQRVMGSHDRFWRTGELAGSPSTRQHLLSALVNEGELRRVRRGLYWRGSKSPLGMAPPSTDALIHEFAPGPGVGPAGLYAANLLRLSTQLPRQAEIAVPARAPGDLELIRFVARPSRDARVSAGLTPTEVALLEVLGSWESAIELPPDEAWRRLQALMSSGQVRTDRIARAGRTEPGSIRARLRELLRASGHSGLAEQVPASDDRTSAAARRVLPFAS
jgi:hypothetical protein